MNKPNMPEIPRDVSSRTGINPISGVELPIPSSAAIANQRDTKFSPTFVMLLSVLFFSMMILCVKMASSYYTHYEIVSFRGLVGAMCLLIYLRVAYGYQLSVMKTPYLGMQFWRALIGTLSTVTWFYGVARLPLANSSTISNMSSIWIALFIVASTMLAGKGKPDYRLVGAILLGFLGVLIMLRPDMSNTQLWPSFVVLLSSVFTALAYLQVAALGRVGEPVYRTVFYFCVFGSLLGLAATLVVQGGFSTFSWIGLCWMLPIGVMAILAQLCVTYAFARGNAMVNACIEYLSLVLMALFDWMLGLGLPQPLTLVGIVLIVSSGFMAALLRNRKANN